MFHQKRNLFRKESLERLSSPERLDQLMQVVSPKSWLPLAALGSLVGVGIVWSIYGRIPITIEGKGVLIYPGHVNAGTSLGGIHEVNSSNKLVGATYFKIADGKKIQKGMKIQITPQTVERERFGGIVGTVREVSLFPITKEAAANVVGNSALVEVLLSQKQEAYLQVLVDLNPANNFSGYKWSSSSDPHLKISAGTTATARVLVEERAPITYIFPMLRSFSGIY
ncbi:secretion protein HlyD [Calothrix sp. NIES-4071]|nr:secretion protein HlyD [Calothrix sp. NIES-4071]BAZ56760.1 secretion protein HlyD [Calothrix sp. NIES-4105]